MPTHFNDVGLSHFNELRLNHFNGIWPNHFHFEGHLIAEWSWSRDGLDHISKLPKIYAGNWNILIQQHSISQRGQKKVKEKVSCCIFYIHCCYINLTKYENYFLLIIQAPTSSQDLQRTPAHNMMWTTPQLDVMIRSWSRMGLLSNIYQFSNPDIRPGKVISQFKERNILQPD